MTFNLSQKTVVVIGGAKRIGREIVLQSARYGAHVAFSYNSSQVEALELLHELQAEFPSQKFAAYPLEISNSKAVADFAETVFGEFENVSGLVNCAAIFRRTPFQTLGESDFDEHIAANLKGPFLLCEAFGRRFMNQAGGSIVNFSDIYATRPLANYVPYCISKAGVEMLTKTLAKALAPQVRVNCVAPGTILLPSEMQGKDDSADELLARIPFARLGKSSEVALTVIFLLFGPEFLTGIIVPLDGGQSLR